MGVWLEIETLEGKEHLFFGSGGVVRFFDVGEAAILMLCTGERIAVSAKSRAIWDMIRQAQRG